MSSLSMLIMILNVHVYDSTRPLSFWSIIVRLDSKILSNSRKVQSFVRRSVFLCYTISFNVVEASKVENITSISETGNV